MTLWSAAEGDKSQTFHYKVLVISTALMWNIIEKRAVLLKHNAQINVFMIFFSCCRSFIVFESLKYQEYKLFCFQSLCLSMHNIIYDMLLLNLYCKCTCTCTNMLNLRKKKFNLEACHVGTVCVYM